MAGKARWWIGGVLLAGVVAAVLALEGAGGHAVAGGPLATSAEAARVELEARLAQDRAALVQKARKAAAAPRLLAALAAQVDAATIVDLFATERWWRPYRDEFRVSRLVTATEIATFGQFETSEEERPLVDRARREGEATAVMLWKGQPFQVVAARVGAPGEGAPVVVLAKPCDSTWLTQIAELAQVGLMLLDDQAPLLIAGAPALRGFLQAIGPETRGSVTADPEGRWSAAAIDLGNGVRLWALRAVTGAAVPAPSRLALWLWIGAGVFGCAGLVGLILLMRRQPGGGSPFSRTTSVYAQAVADARSTAPLSLVSSRKTSSSLEGRTFGRYRLVKKIAEGGMSEIYRAVANGPRGFQRPFVVKRLKPELSLVKEAVNQFIDEARVQASLVHSNVVPVYDFGNLDNEYYMTEEYIVGRDLLRLSQRCASETGAPMPPHIGYYIACETLQALHYAHTRQDEEGRALDIVHRDVSTINIMVTTSGDVKLFDFGIAKGNHRIGRTQTGVLKGNLQFMSPEHARGQPVDARSDVFSVGLVLYFCLTNQMLYTGENDLDVLHRAACGPTDSDWQRISLLPSPAAALLAGALEIDPARRYESAAEFAAALSPHAANAKYEVARLVQNLFAEELRAEMAIT